MSKLKTPQDKKAASLANDRRNTYRENAKSSRKNIPLSKQLSRKAVRRISNQTLQEIVQAESVDEFDRIESKHRSKVAQREHNAFVKWPDRALKDVLEQKRSGKYIRTFTRRNKP